MSKISRTLSSAVLATVIAAPALQASAAEVNIYSYRQQFLIQPLLEAFTEETGIKANIVFSKKGLLERLKIEGKNSPADVLLTADIGPLHDAVEKGLLQTLNSDLVNNNVPARFRDPEGNWVGLTTRSRIIYASKDRVKPGEIASYEDLADPKWKGRICNRSGKHTYNLSLIGAMLEEHGEADTKTWLEGFKTNLARKPQGNDRTQVKAVKEGVCDIALGNSYYFGKMITNDKKPEQKAWAESVNLIFPNQADRGAHMNISGAGITKYAPHRSEAQQLIEFLTTEKAQRIYAEANFEFPVKDGTPWSPLLKKYMSEFKQDPVNLQRIAAQRANAAKLVDQVGYDN